MSISQKITDLLARLTDIPHSCPDCGRSFLDEDRLRRHREIEEDGEFVVFRCTECGRIEQSLAVLHAHAEGHRSFLTAVFDGGNANALMEYTEKLRVTEYEEIDPVGHLRGASSE